MSASTTVVDGRVGPAIVRCTRCQLSETPTRPITQLGRDGVEGLTIGVCGECMQVLVRETKLEPASRHSVPRCGHSDCQRSQDTLTANGATLFTLPGTFEGGVVRICSDCVKRGHVRLFSTRWVLPTAIGVALLLAAMAYAVSQLR